MQVLDITCRSHDLKLFCRIVGINPQLGNYKIGPQLKKKSKETFHYKTLSYKCITIRLTITAICESVLFISPKH